jgi:hypothetical protein
MCISKIYFISPYINIYRHVSVASATIVEVPCKNTNNIQTFEFHGSVHHNTVRIKITKMMQLCRIIYYSIFP